MDDTKRPFLPYARQHVAQEDIDAVVEVLRSDWWTQGPTIVRFEEALAQVTGAREVVACASGTAALHLAMLALGLGPGDAVVTSANTFLADANCARYVGADVIFADIDPGTGCMTPDTLKAILKEDTYKRIKAVIPVHFAGQPVDLPSIHQMASQHGAAVVDDACHALGASYESEHTSYKVGSGAHAEMTVLSFHPVKHVATGEGGAICTGDRRLAKRLRTFRTHGITKSDFVQTEWAYALDGSINPWYYEMSELGFNYRLTDLQAALGISQLKRLDCSVRRRNEIAFEYRSRLARIFPDSHVRPLNVRSGLVHAYHLFVVLIDFDHYQVSRANVMASLKQEGIGTQVHYIPVPLQPYYTRIGAGGRSRFPNAETYYAGALSLPMFPDMRDSDVTRVIDELHLAMTGSDR